MRNRFIIKILLLLAVICTSVSSCVKGFDEFLDKPPGVDITEDTIFSTKKDIETFVFGTYMYGIHSYYPYNTNNGSVNPNPTMCMTAPMCDEAEMAQSYFTSQEWNTGSILANNIKNQEDKRFDLRWTAIRRCNIIIERLPGTTLTQREKDQYLGETLFLRALNNFEMFKRYGGMPIVDKRLTEADDWNKPRASVADFVNYIVNDCNESARLLKGVVYNANQRGRVTDAAALALKAKTLLYAASPLFNTDEPYLPTDHPELVCYGNRDPQRWKQAADAALAALGAARTSGFKLLDNDDVENDYRKVWDTYDNEEIILAEKFDGKKGNWQAPWGLILPAGLGMNGWAGNAVCVPHNFVCKYEKMNGDPQTWNEPGVPGTDLMEKYAELDPRFRQTMAYNGSSWNHLYTDMQLYEGAKGQSPGPGTNATGVMMHKLIPYAMSNSTNYQMEANAILFRVGELYLDYAEALNEYLSSPSQEVYDAVNTIRDRAGMPDLPTGLSQKQMRDRIKNERAVELAYEDHRLWDIRRWMDAEKEGVMQGSFYKVVITRKSGTGLSQKCDYVISEYEKRVFNRNMYLHPIFESEVNKGYMIQNPGW